MIEGEDDASSGPKRNGRHFLGRLYQLRGWPPGWHSWTSELDDMLMTDDIASSKLSKFQQQKVNPEFYSY